MIDLQTIIESLNRSIPQLSIDCVIFGFHNQELKVLLSKLPATEFWALQGGYIRQNEDIDDAAKRILEEGTGLKGIFLEQFYVFGKANRPSFEFLKKSFDSLSETIKIEEVPFLTKRFVSIGYYSLVDFSRVTPLVSVSYERSEWFDIQKRPELGFDHEEMIQKALEKLRHSLDYALIGFNLMPETFTMNELQKLYETILGESMSRNNFQRKMLDMNILERLEKKFTGSAHKAPYLYKFKK
jgi:8-oxo-dGTP diphosphatase